MHYLIEAGTVVMEMIPVGLPNLNCPANRDVLLMGVLVRCPIKNILQPEKVRFPLATCSNHIHDPSNQIPHIPECCEVLIIKTGVANLLVSSNKICITDISISPL